jgi:hypothetical protein
MINIDEAGGFLWLEPIILSIPKNIDSVISHQLETLQEPHSLVAISGI